jgi:hypothetical protein
MLVKQFLLIRDGSMRMDLTYTRIARPDPIEEGKASSTDCSNRSSVVWKFLGLVISLGIIATALEGPTNAAKASAKNTRRPVNILARQ